MDVNPQWLTHTLAMIGTDTYTQDIIALPVSRFQQKNKRAMVMEVLKVHFFLAVKLNFAGADAVSTSAVLVSTKNLSSFEPTDPSVIATADREYRNQAGGGQDWESIVEGPIVVDLTDGAGHGLIVATDQIYLSQQTSNFGGPSGCIYRLLYRWKEVGLEEYIGVVQSQQ